MLKNKIFDLRNLGYSYRQISKQLCCSISTVSYHLRNEINTNIIKPIDDIKKEKIREYYKSNTLEETAKFFNVSPTTVKKYSDNKRSILSKEEKRERHNQRVSNRRRECKRILVEYKGGRCIKCGYDKYIGALEFHHIDPTQKDFNISNKGKTISLENLKKEVDKCDLVCSNCHKEIHGNVS